MQQKYFNRRPIEAVKLHLLLENNNTVHYINKVITIMRIGFQRDIIILKTEK